MLNRHCNEDRLRIAALIRQRFSGRNARSLASLEERLLDFFHSMRHAERSDAQKVQAHLQLIADSMRAVGRAEVFQLVASSSSEEKDRIRQLVEQLLHEANAISREMLHAGKVPDA
jgi:hypothetical protein